MEQLYACVKTAVQKHPHPERLTLFELAFYGSVLQAEETTDDDGPCTASSGEDEASEHEEEGK